MTFHFIPEQADATEAQNVSWVFLMLFTFLTTADTHVQYRQRLE